MTDGYRDLHGDAYKEWRDERADEFAAIQRRAFLAGFEAAADESETFRYLRNWLEEKRDEAKRKYDERDGDDMMFSRNLAFKDTLVKLHEMGCTPEVDTEPDNAADCLESLNGLECHRSDGHDGSHQASAFENDGHYDLQLVEWWSIKPNGDPVEADTE